MCRGVALAASTAHMDGDDCDNGKKGNKAFSWAVTKTMNLECEIVWNCGIFGVLTKKCLRMTGRKKRTWNVNTTRVVWCQQQLRSLSRERRRPERSWMAEVMWKAGQKTQLSNKTTKIQPRKKYESHKDLSCVEWCGSFVLVLWPTGPVTDRMNTMHMDNDLLRNQSRWNQQTTWLASFKKIKTECTLQNRTKNTLRTATHASTSASGWWIRQDDEYNAHGQRPPAQSKPLNQKCNNKEFMKN